MPAPKVGDTGASRGAGFVGILFCSPDPDVVLLHQRLDEEILKKIADVTPGEYFHSRTAPELQKIYQSLNARFVLEKEPVEVTALFSAAAAVTALFSALLSLLWFKRIL